MELTDYARVLRRRWLTIATFALGALFIAFMTMPTSTQLADQSRSAVSYSASSVLIADSTKQPVNLGRLALVAAAGEVPNSAARALGKTARPVTPSANPSHAGQQQRVRIGNATVTIVGDSSTDSLRITAVSPNGPYSVLAAGTLANKLIAFTNRTAQEAFDTQLASLQATSDKFDTQISDLGDQIFAATAQQSPELPRLKSKQEDLIRRQSTVDSNIADLRQQGPNDFGLSILQTGPAARIDSGGGFKAPSSSGPRLAIALLIGLLLGVFVALVRERLDSSVRGHQATEDATKLPVIAEVPYMRVSRRNRFIVAVEAMSGSLVAESYRRLRTSISLMWIANHRPSDGEPQPTSDDTTPRVLIVTSPIPADGKSTTTANLAAAFAETGKRIIVIDLDFRRQKLHRFLGTKNEPALENLGTSTDPRVDIEALLQDTDIPNVRFISSAHTHSSPADAVLAAKCAIAAAVQIADMVVLDAPPLLLTNDTYDFIELADVLLLVAREGHTTRGSLSRASQVLRRLEAPVLGTVLIAARDDKSSYYGYKYLYGYGYGGYGSGSYGERDDGRRRRGLFGRKRRRDDAAPERSDVGAPSRSPNA